MTSAGSKNDIKYMETQSQKTSNGVNKLIRNLVLLIIVVVVVGFIGYYIWPKQIVEREKTLADYLQFNIVRIDLDESQIAEYKKEFEVVKASLEQREDQLEGWLWLGSLKKRVGDYQGAEEAWIKAGEIRPLNSPSFGNLADLYSNFTKEYDKVEAVSRKAIENSLGEDKNVYFYRNFYDFYRYYLQDNEKAAAILLEAIQNNPQSGELLIVSAQFYRDTGDKQKAVDYYEQALELNPDNEAAAQELAELKSSL